MPARIVVKGQASWSGAVHPRHVHGFACRLFEASGVDHNGGRKPFSVGAVRREDDVLLLELSCLDDDVFDPARIVEEVAGGVRFGSERLVDPSVRFESIPFASLIDPGAATRADVRFGTPTFFSRSGRDYLLPDPELIVGGLARRWNRFAPAIPFAIPDGEVAALRRSVIVTSHRVESRRMPGPGGTKTGFVGTATLALHGPARADARMAGQFTALVRFAELAGVGAATPFGFGAVTVALDAADERGAAARRDERRVRHFTAAFGCSSDREGMRT